MPNGAAGGRAVSRSRRGPQAGRTRERPGGRGSPRWRARRLLRRRQLVVDHVLEALEGLRARHQAAVDDEAGRAAHADRAALLHLRVHRGGALLVVEAVVPGVHVDAGVGQVLGGLLLDVVLVDLGLVLEEALVELPEGVRLLLLGALGGDGARFGPRMEGQRVALVVEADLVAVLLQDLVLDRGVAPAAERTLEVGVLDDGHLGVGGTFDGLILQVDLRHDGLRGVDGHVFYRAEGHEAAVRRRDDGDLLRTGPLADLERPFLGARDARVVEPRHRQLCARRQVVLLAVVLDQLLGIGALARRRRGRGRASYRSHQRPEHQYESTHGLLLLWTLADLRGHKCPSLRAGSSAPAPLPPLAPPAT